MKLSQKSCDAIAASLKEALRRYVAKEDMSVVTDIHLQPNADNGELLVFNDEEEELSHTVVDEWVEYESDDFYKEVEPLLRSVLTDLKESGKLDNTCLLKPYSFVLVDDEKETIAELLLIDDDDTLLLDEELLKGLDEELDDFLQKLLNVK